MSAVWFRVVVVLVLYVAVVAFACHVAGTAIDSPSRRIGRKDGDDGL
jgi:hypothetical protein